MEIETDNRVLSGVPLPLLSPLLDLVGLCWVRSDEHVVTDMGLAGACSLLLEIPATITGLARGTMSVQPPTTAK